MHFYIFVDYFLAMKITEILENNKGHNLVSFEILPPLKGQNIQSIFDAIDPLMEFNPAFIL